MNAKEFARLRRLELENEELRKAIEKHLDVYRDQAIELIDLRAKLNLLREMMNG